MEKCRTLLVDNHPLLLDGMRSLLTPYPDIDIVGASSVLEEVLKLAKTHKPQLIIMEIAINDGMDLVKRLRTMFPLTKLIIYTTYSDQRYLPELVHLGIMAHVLKTDQPNVLLQAIHEVRKGNVFLTSYDPGGYLVGLMRARLAKPHSEDLSNLSKRENEIFLLLAQGMPIRHIASSLHLSPKTVESHKYNLFHKLHINSLSELIKIAIRHGLIQI